MVYIYLPFCHSNLMKGENSVEKFASNGIRDAPEAFESQHHLSIYHNRTTFLVGVHFAEKGKNTIKDKEKN